MRILSCLPQLASETQPFIISYKIPEYRVEKQQVAVKGPGLCVHQGVFIDSRDFFLPEKPHYLTRTAILPEFALKPEITL